MKLKGSKINELGHLSALCKDDLATSTKIALLSFQEGKTQPVFEIFILLIEYFQLVSQSFLTRKNSDNMTDYGGSLSGGVLFIAKLFNPAHWINFGFENDLVFVVLTAVLIYTLFKFLLFTYIVIVAYYNVPQNAILTQIWKWNFKLQGRVICFVVTSFWLETVLATFENNFDIFGIGKAGSIGLFITLLLVEYIFSFFLSTQYCIIVPTKSLLSSKDYHMENLTLSQKFVVQIIQVTFSAYTMESNVVYALVNIFFCLVRNTHCFVTFPLYNMKMLLYQAFLLMVVTSLNFSCLFQVITDSLDYQDEVLFIAIVWIIITLLMTKISFGYLLKTRLKLITSNKKVSPGLLVHKIIAIKQLRKQKKIPGEFNMNYQYAYLLNTAIDAEIESVFNVDSRNLKTENPTIDYKDSANELFANYLDGLLARFPRNNFIKLYIAEFYAKKLKLYGVAMKLLTGLQNSHSNVTSLNASILIWKIQNLVRKKDVGDDNHIDLYVFFKTQMRYVKLKKLMHKQNEAQIELYEEILDEGPDLLKVFDLGQIITGYRNKVERETNQMLADMPDYYVQPLLHCAHYHSIMNSSMEKYTKFHTLYTRKSHKYQKFFEMENLKPENYYQDGNAFALISGQKDDFGKIIFCTNSVSKIYGGDVNLYIGANISTLAPLSSQSFYSLFFENKSMNEQNELRGGVFRGFSFHKEGHLVELDFYLDVFPFLTGGFYFSLIIRPTHTKKEYILLRENGDIEGATRKIVSQLKLNRHHIVANGASTVNIKYISEELGHINHAFNIVMHSDDVNKQDVNEIVDAKGLKRKESPIKYLCSSSLKKDRVSPRDDPHIDGDLATQVYSMYTKEGKNIQLFPVSNKEFRRVNTINTEDGSKPLVYNCKMKVIAQGSEMMKLVILDENKRANASSKYLASKVMTSKIMSPEAEYMNKMSGEIVDNRIYKESSIAVNKADIMEKLNMTDTRSENFGDLASEGGDKADRKHYQPKIFFTGQEDISKALRTNDLGFTEGNLLSPMSPGGNPARSLLHHHTNLLSPVSPKVLGQTITMDDNKQNILNYGSNSTESERDEDEHKDKLGRLYDDVTSKASGKSRLSQKKQVTRAFNLALNTKYYSRLLKFLFILCYLILITVLALQVQVKTSLDSTIDNLQTKKDLLRSSQQRDFLLVSVHRATRFVWDVGTGQLITSTLGAAAAFTVNTYRDSGNTSMKSLAKVNQKVLVNAGDLEPADRQELFYKDVDVYYNTTSGGNQYNTMTNFQAADSIVETGLKAYACSKINITNCKEGFDYIFRNALNDLLVKSESVSGLFLDAIQNEIQDRRDSLAYLLAVRLFLLLIICFSLSWIIGKQYVKEKINMLALMRLDAKGLKEALDRLSIFKTSLETGDSIEGRTHKRIMQSAKKSYKSQGIKRKQTKKGIQEPDHRGILKRNLIFIGKSLLCVLVLCGFSIFSSVSASNSIEFLKTEQSKLYFADNMATRTNYAFLAAMEIYASNNGSMMRNEPVSVQLDKSVDDLNSLKNTVIDVFLPSNSDPDPLLQGILLVDGCKYLNSSSATYCRIITSRGKKLNLVNLLSDYEALIEEKYQNFLVISHDSVTLRKYQAQSYDLLLSMQRVLGDQSTLIATRINTIFEEKFESVKVQGDWVFSVFVVALVIISVLLWVLVFKEIREGINRFKNVLQAFPPNLILANFILKSFLVYTSRGVLDSVKNDI